MTHARDGSQHLDNWHNSGVWQNQVVTNKWFTSISGILSFCSVVKRTSLHMQRTMPVEQPDNVDIEWIQKTNRTENAKQTLTHRMYMNDALNPNIAWTSFEDHRNTHLVPIRRSQIDEAVRKEQRFQSILISLQKSRFVDLSTIHPRDHMATIMHQVGLNKPFEIGQYIQTKNASHPSHLTTASKTIPLPLQGDRFKLLPPRLVCGPIFAMKIDKLLTAITSFD